MGEWFVGQKVIVRSRGRNNDVEAEVVKVGRKLVYIRLYGRETAFRMDTGVINDNYSGCRLITPEIAARQKAESEALARLHATGLRLNYDSRKLSVDEMNAVADLLERNAEATQ